MKYFLFLILFTVTSVSAELVPLNGSFGVFDDWTQIANDDGETTPGSGGQDFDAEFLFYKYNDQTHDLSIGLQTGYDIISGKVTYGGHDYYAGDLALSFDGNVATTGTSRAISNTYEYAIDFGNYTEDYYGNAIESSSSGGVNGVDAAGLYKVDTGTKDNLRWNNRVYYTDSAPFAMSEGTLEQNILMDYGQGTLDGQQSYWRTATFNVDDYVGELDLLSLDAHWTMSCGNDFIDGEFADLQVASVPAPPALWLFASGLMGFVITARRRSISGIEE